MVVPWTPEMKHIALDRFKIAGSTSTRLVGDDMGVCHSMAWCVVREKFMQPFYVQRVQCLYADDYQHRLDLAK
ncbi:hypothetical protein NPIL_528841 [Nephila pilipes]|uniref:Uncharacterized protein n=1 Tax=Nephila pilipes TaxID=299642 RepID=A0A8X6PWI3_NEPPI|nr:hypothetical protein NPIL_528841 [Nephila pilipes]